MFDVLQQFVSKCIRFLDRIIQKIVTKAKGKVKNFRQEVKENSKRVRDTSLWKVMGYACGMKVNFSPCVMTGAVLAMVVLGTPGGCAGCLK